MADTLHSSILFLFSFVIMGAGKNKAHRKNRISKHVIDSQKRRKEEEESSSSVAPELNTDLEKRPKPPASKKRKKTNHIKDPAEAHAYLSAWKHKSSGEGFWKFNKNTQSWLLRHMYEIEKVPKATFSIFMEYIDGLNGDLTRKRIHEDAMRRALRYKEWGKDQNENSSGETKNENDDQKENEDKDGEDDTQYWLSLSDGDKRKEYKRARKVIDVMGMKGKELGMG